MKITNLTQDEMTTLIGGLSFLSKLRPEEKEFNKELEILKTKIIKQNIEQMKEK